MRSCLKESARELELELLFDIRRCGHAKSLSTQVDAFLPGLASKGVTTGSDELISSDGRHCGLFRLSISSLTLSLITLSCLPGIFSL